MATIRKNTTGFYMMTSAEVAEWRQMMIETNGPWDSAGEPWVCSGVGSVEVPAGTEVEVLRARCSANIGWRSVSGYTEVRLPSGAVCKVERCMVDDAATKRTPVVKKASAIDARISLFAIEVQEMLIEHRTGCDTMVSVDWGRRYAKLIRTESFGRSVYCFVDRTNGDVLKAASWSAPAKHARGSVMAETTEERLSGVGPYGANYL